MTRNKIRSVAGLMERACGLEEGCAYGGGVGGGGWSGGVDGAGGGGQLSSPAGHPTHAAAPMPPLNVVHPCEPPHEEGMACPSNWFIHQVGWSLTTPTGFVAHHCARQRRPPPSTSSLTVSTVSDDCQSKSGSSIMLGSARPEQP